MHWQKGWITSAHVYDLMARAGANALSTIPNFEKIAAFLKKNRKVPILWWKGRATHKTVERNLCNSPLDHWLAHTLFFLHWGLMLVQLVKTGRKHERFIEDLGDDIRVTPGFGFYLRPSYCSLDTCKAQWVGLLGIKWPRAGETRQGRLRRFDEAIARFLDAIEITIFSRFLWCPGRWRQREPWDLAHAQTLFNPVCNGKKDLGRRLSFRKFLFHSPARFVRLKKSSQRDIALRITE